jgi:hypothetical protein
MIFDDIFRDPPLNLVFPETPPGSGSIYWDPGTGGVIGPDGPFWEVYSRGAPSTDVMENVDWVSFPGNGTNAQYWPIIVGTKLNKALSLDRLTGVRFNTIPPCLTSDKQDAYAIGFTSTQIDVIHFSVNPSSADHELTFEDRHQITPTGTVFTGDSVLPENAVVDDDGNLYTFRWMRPAGSYLQRVEIVKYNNEGTVLWRNDDFDNDVDPDGGIVFCPPNYIFAPNGTLTDWFDGSYIFAFATGANFQFKCRYTCQDTNWETAHDVRNLTFEWQIGSDASFTTITAQGSGVAVASGTTETQTTVYSATISTDAANLRTFPWPNEAAEARAYIRVRGNDGERASAWHEFSLHIYSFDGINGRTDGGNPAFLGYTGNALNGYRWLSPQSGTYPVGTLTFNDGELVLAVSSRGYHYTDSPLPDKNEYDQYIVHYANIFYRFSLADGAWIASEYITQPTENTENLAWTTVCQPISYDGKFYVYSGRKGRTVGGVIVYYRLVDIRTNVSGIWTHVERIDPAGGWYSNWGTGWMYIIGAQPYVLCIYQNACAMPFTIDGFGTETVYELSPAVFYSLKNYAMSIDHQRLYIYGYADGDMAYVGVHCLPVPLPPTVHCFPWIGKFRMCKVP